MSSFPLDTKEYFEAGLRYENAVQYPTEHLLVPATSGRYYFFNLNKTCEDIQGVEIGIEIDSVCSNKIDIFLTHADV